LGTNGIIDFGTTVDDRRCGDATVSGRVRPNRAPPVKNQPAPSRTQPWLLPVAMTKHTAAVAGAG